MAGKLDQQTGTPGSPFVMASPFILKTFSLVEDPETDSFIRWTDDGNAFVVTNVEEFRDILAKHFSHSNFCSFVRQLNFYGFHKLASKDNTFCFGDQPLFQRNQPHLLAHIKRRNSSKTKRSSSVKKQDDPEYEPPLDSDPIDDEPRGGSQELERDLVLKRTQTGQKPVLPKIGFSELLAAKGFQLEDGAGLATADLAAKPEVLEGRIKDASGVAPDDSVMHQLVLSLRELQTDMSSVRQELAETRKENQRLREELQELKRERLKTEETVMTTTMATTMMGSFAPELRFLPATDDVVDHQPGNGFSILEQPPSFLDFGQSTGSLLSSDGAGDPAWMNLLNVEDPNFSVDPDDSSLNEFLDSFQRSQLS